MRKYIHTQNDNLGMMQKKVMRVNRTHYPHHVLTFNQQKVPQLKEKNGNTDELMFRFCVSREPQNYLDIKYIKTIQIIVTCKMAVMWLHSHVRCVSSVFCFVIWVVNHFIEVSWYSRHFIISILLWLVYNHRRLSMSLS